MGHDASDSGYNVVEVRSDGSTRQQIRYPFSREEKLWSSSAREATALLHSLQIKGECLKGHKIQTFRQSSSRVGSD